MVIETPLEEKMQQIAYAREMLDFLESHPELITHLELRATTFIYAPYNIADADKRDNVLDQMRPLVRSMNDGAPMGGVRKIDSESYYGFERFFGEDNKIIVLTPNSSTCEYVETGEMEEVEVVDIPERVAAQYTTTVSRPVVKRVCPKLFSEGD